MALRRRTAKIFIFCTLFPALLTGCRLEGEGSYHPPLLPIELSIDTDGNVHVNASAEIATPIGTFSLQQSLAHRNISTNQTLLIIRRLANGVLADYLIKIKSSVKMTFLVNGSYDFTSEDNVAVVKPHPGVSGIRIQNDQKQESAPRLSAKRVDTLPEPSDISSPPATGRPDPSESAGCPDPASCPPATGEPYPSPSD